MPELVLAIAEVSAARTDHYLQPNRYFLAHCGDHARAGRGAASERPAHSSTRSAPPRSEATADSTESITNLQAVFCRDEFGAELPHAAAVLAHHWLARFAAECLLELGYVYY